MVVAQKIYNVTYAIPNLNHANKVLTKFQNLYSEEFNYNYTLPKVYLSKSTFQLTK